MAKQRRAPKKANSKRQKKRAEARASKRTSARRPSAGRAAKTALPARKSSAAKEAATAEGAARRAESVATESPRQSDHLDALASYERGVRLLQQHEYDRAGALFQAILENHPEEKELHERVRLYLNVCLRATKPADSTPKDADERVYAATLAMNTGAYRQALSHLQAAVRERPGHEHAHYMLAVVHASLRNLPDALASLQRAIELNPDNRAQAARDADFDLLRDNPRFRALVGGARRL